MNKHLTHPQIHLDYYAWLSGLSKFEKEFVKEHSKSPEDAHALLMFAWTCSRETLKNEQP